MTTNRKHIDSHIDSPVHIARSPSILCGMTRVQIDLGTACASGIGARVGARASAILFACLAIAGCSTSSTNRTYLPSGDVGFTINCSGDSSESSWAECYKKAGEACGAYGYDVISKDTDGGGSAGGTLGGVLSANVKNRSLVVRCKQ